MTNQKISVARGGGPVIFLGTMNAMPMMYAMELKKQGIDVLYFVDVSVDDKLSRPENHFPDISYPYPNWIIEMILRTQMVIPFLSPFFARKIASIVSRYSGKKPQAYVLSGFFVSLAPYLSKSAAVISLPHGSDLDSWADVAGAETLSERFVAYSIFRYIPRFLAKKAIRYVVGKQYVGFKSSNKVVYFPRGFSAHGDRVVNNLISAGVGYHERYDISFEPLLQQSREYKPQGDKLVVFSGVRFNFETFTEGNSEYNKGNDKIIEGLSKFFKSNKNLEVHFVEKGPDVDKAKILCRQYGLDSVVVWHKEMAFKELLKLYERADICFDQVGSHWIAAIGAYALWLGKPLIANDFLPVASGFWPKSNPVCSATSADEVFGWLIKLSNDSYRREVSSESKIFAEKYFSSEKVISEVFELSV